MQREQDVVDLASDDEQQHRSRDRSLSPDLQASSPENSPPRARFRSNNDRLLRGLREGRVASSLSSSRREQQPVISLVQSPDITSSRSNTRSSSNNESTRNPGNSANQQWTCSRCTLINPTTQSRCSACEAIRQVDDDEVIYQRTINSSNQRNQGSSTSHFVGGGAFLGGMLGAADAYANGTGIARGAMRGAVSGAVGGALYREILRPVAPPSAAAAAGASYRTLGSNASYAAAFSNDGWGHRPNNTNIYHNRVFLDRNNVFDYMMQSMAMRQQPNIDNMSYEALLERFGDGNENKNLAASQQTIASLPSSIISDPNELPEDKRQCVICMEDYEKGDERTMLPCWHGFHKECVNRWLSSKGSCPVCKTEIG